MIELHEDARKRVVELLTVGLREIQVQRNCFLNYHSLTGVEKAEAALPNRQSQIGKRLAALISNEPLTDFVAGELASALDDRDYDSKSDQQPLTSIPEYADTNALAASLVDSFVSLPWQYHAFAALPWDIAQLLDAAIASDSFELGNRVALIRGAAAARSHPRSEKPEQRSLLVDTPTGLNDQSLYLCAGFSGYVGPFGTTTPLDEAQLLVRSFFGLCIALRIARVGAYYAFGPQKRELLVYKESQVGWRYHSAHDIPADTSNAIAALGVNKKLAEFAEDVRVAITARELNTFRAVFSKENESQAILLASQWLFDSSSTSNRLLGFVQAMVALEALLGDKSASDQVGLGELLASRAAYLIANSKAQRDEILKDFRRIYETRSKIIHRGKNRLSTNELYDLSTLEWLCARVIQEEAKLLSTS